MHEYHVVIRTDTYWAEMSVEAENPDAAIKKVFKTDYAEINFQPYQEIGGFESIEVYEDDSEEKALVEWHRGPPLDNAAAAEVYALVVLFLQHMKRGAIFRACRCAMIIFRIVSVEHAS